MGASPVQDPAPHQRDIDRPHSSPRGVPASRRSIPPMEDCMHTARSSLSIMMFLSIAACSADREPTMPRPAAASVSASQGVQISVTGGGIVDFSTAGVGNGYFAFNGLVKGDGTAHGRFHQRRDTPLGVVDFTGTVTCLTIDPVLGRARFGGIITENNSTHPSFLTVNHEIGDDVWFRVQDGGEGGDAVDASTTYGFKPTLVNTSAEYCALPFTGPSWNPLSTFPLRSGNIQIRF